MVTIVAVRLIGRIILSLALLLAFAMRSSIVCAAAAHEDCHHSSRSDAPQHPCCNPTMCLSALDARHDVVTPAPSLAITFAPAPITYLMPRHSLEVTPAAVTTPSPPRYASRIIELRTLLI
jgi:hypothetical protein